MSSSIRDGETWEQAARRICGERLRASIKRENQLATERDALKAELGAAEALEEHLQGQLAELREAAAELVDHIERKYYHLVSPSPAAQLKHGSLGELARAVHAILAKLTP